LSEEHVGRADYRQKRTGSEHGQRMHASLQRKMKKHGQCEATTHAGTRCQAPKMDRGKYCGTHR